MKTLTKENKLLIKEVGMAMFGIGMVLLAIGAYFKFIEPGLYAMTIDILAPLSIGFVYGGMGLTVVGAEFKITSE